MAWLCSLLSVKEPCQTTTKLIQQPLRGEILSGPAGPDGITAEMLKYGGEIVVYWMMWICNLAREQSKVSEDWKKAIIVPIYKGKGKIVVDSNGKCLGTEL